MKRSDQIAWKSCLTVGGISRGSKIRLRLEATVTLIDFSVAIWRRRCTERKRNNPSKQNSFTTLPGRFVNRKQTRLVDSAWVKGPGPLLGRPLSQFGKSLPLDTTVF